MRLGLVALLACACNGSLRERPTPASDDEPSASTTNAETPKPSDTGEARALRERMVREQIEARDVRDARVLAALRSVPRHLFVPGAALEDAYGDSPLAIEAEQTISQPYIVALMTELAQLKPGARVLEVGTGSGYQAAVLAALGAQVWSIEIVEQLARSADARLRELGYAVSVRHGDGYAGWPEHAPFDAIIVTAAPPAIPEPLLQQLAVGGRLVVPVGRGSQELYVITRTASGYDRKNVLPVRFVPMTGRAQEAE